MKRKFLMLFLTIISAVCFSIGISACDVLNDFLSSSYTQSSQTASGSESTVETSSSGDSTGSDSTGETSSSSDSTGSDSTGETSSSGDSTGSDSTGQTSSSGDSTGSDSTGQTSSDDEGTDDEDTEKSDFTLRAGNSDYGYKALASLTNGTAMQSVYYQMYTACEAFATSTEDVTISGGYYTIAKISYSGSLTSSEATSVWSVFYAENPMYYWLSGTCVYSESSSTLYLNIDETYASYTVRTAYDAAIASMVEEASELVTKNSTELEIAMAMHDYIIGKIDYAYQSDGTTPETAIWAHNITGVSSKQAGVCEAYAKTYLALCLINGLDCIIVSGTATSNGEGHAWNLVEIDGVWYGVDCTWDDTGTSTLSYTYFGMNASALASGRTADVIYSLPEATAYGIQLITLFKGETELGMYVNIDAAFAAMTDTAADYTIEFYFYNTSNTKVEISSSTTVYIYSAYTPAVNSITINGIYTDMGDSNFTVTELTAESKITLKCDLVISNMYFNTAELDLGEYTLTTSGHYCNLDGKIYDSKTSDTVSIKSETEYQTAIYAEINVSYYSGNSLIAGKAEIGTYYGSDSLMVYGGTVTIGKYISAMTNSYYNIYLQEKGTLSVSNLVYDSGSSKAIYVLIQFDSIEKYPTLYLGNVDAQTYLYISGNVSTTETTAEAATPSNLSCAIATLGDASDFTYINIIFVSGNTAEDNTKLYTVNTDKEIVYSGS